MAKRIKIASSFCKEDEEKLQTERCWSELPTELLSVISQHILLGDRHVFHAVCKSWNSVEKLSLTLPPCTDSPYFDSPCLMFTLYKKDEKIVSWKLFHSVYNDSYYVDFPELLGAEICYSKDGWLLMFQRETTYFFFNPSTKIKIELPPIDDSFYQVCFTSAPITGGDCIIFGILPFFSESCSSFAMMRFGESNWREYECSNEYTFLTANCSPVYCNGLFYCLDRSQNLGVFNPYPLDEDRRWVQHKKCHTEILDFKVLHQNYMAEVDGEIWCVFVTDDDGPVGVYKLDFENVVWHPMQDLRNKCLYVSPKVSFAENCDVKSLTNKVYFNKFYSKNGVNNGVVYSLAGGMYHSFGGGFASEEAYGLREVNHGTWFKPMRDKIKANIVGS